MVTHTDERWRTIQEFPAYEISNRGEVYNTKRRQEMRTSVNNFGHVKITLTDYDGRRYTRSVAMLVATAFVEPPNILCDHLVVLDGDFTNVQADNLAWRPEWFAWKYTRQLKIPQPTHFQNLHTRNIDTGQEYESIIQASIVEGLLFTQVWKSTYSRIGVFPHGHRFEIIERV